jgi:hypothetical protein
MGCNPMAVVIVAIGSNQVLCYWSPERFFLELRRELAQLRRGRILVSSRFCFLPCQGVVFFVEECSELSHLKQTIAVRSKNTNMPG